MRVYQVCWDGRAKTYRIKKLAVATETPTGFSQPGRPVALWPSKRNTFKRLVEAQAYLVSKRKDGAQTVSISHPEPRFGAAAWTGHGLVSPGRQSDPITTLR